jgi:hypothetical protein
MAFAWAALTLAAACTQDEYALLLDVQSQQPIDRLRVRVFPRDNSRGPTPVEEVVMGASLDGGAALRVAARFSGPVDVVVHLEGRTTAGRTVSVGTRCYAVRGVVRDDVLLVTMADTDDPDGDGWPTPGAVPCLDARGAGTAPCDNACPAGVGADCRGCIGASCPPDELAGMIYPGAPEACENGFDEDCDGRDSMCGDQDGDGFRACSAAGAVGCDCDDRDPARNPRAVDVCGDGIDQDCDGVDAPCDRDGDGYPADRERGGFPDCDDTNPAINPGPMAMEVCTEPGGIPVDENCNGLVDELPMCESDDIDRDTVPDCSLPECGPSTAPPCRPAGRPCDCNDCDPGVRPGAREVCGDGVDQDCDGADLPCPSGDTDRDGEVGASAGGSDCDDAMPRVNTMAPDRCGNGIAENCVADLSCDLDRDGDGYVEPGVCEGDARIVPYSTEQCNGIDDNCNGVTDEVRGGSGYDGCIVPRGGDPACVSSPCGISFATNYFHCGGCRNACVPQQANECRGGACVCTDGVGAGAACGGSTSSFCCPGNGCRDLTSDLEFCGDCGTSCTRSFGTRANACVAGACACGTGAPCAMGQTCCDGICVDLLADPANCGRCGNRCNLIEADPACVMGRCEVAVCRTPTLNADCTDPGSGEDGCETRLDARTHCGMCGTRCDANADCRSSAGPTGPFSCVCRGGWMGSGTTCGDVNECMTGTPCGPNSTCTNTPGSFACACNAGYSSPSGDGRGCVDIDECATATACGRNLSPTNTCTNMPGGYTCSCGSGFTAMGSGLSATCVDVNECMPTNPCAPGTCMNSVGSYSCTCGAGYMAGGSPPMCLDIDECATASRCGRDLSASNTCTNTPGGYTCTCGPGFMLMGSGLMATCVDINECAAATACGRNLSPTNMCTNTPGGYTCTCGSGFMPMGSGPTATCVDINECASPTTCGRDLSAGNMCTNVPGGYTCSCGPGFMLTGTGLSATCVDVDECAGPMACGRHLSATNMCTNMPGGYTCSCGPGFMPMGTGLSATCVDINECMTPGICMMGTCVNSPGSYSCTCNTGWGNCDTDPDCETRLNASPNCGACGTTCTPMQMCCPQGTTFECRMGSC